MHSNEQNNDKFSQFIRESNPLTRRLDVCTPPRPHLTWPLVIVPNFRLLIRCPTRFNCCPISWFLASPAVVSDVSFIICSSFFLLVFLLYHLNFEGRIACLLAGRRTSKSSCMIVTTRKRFYVNLARTRPRVFANMHPNF